MFRPFLPAAIYQSLAVIAQLSVPILFKLIIDEAIGAGEVGLLWWYAGLSAGAVGLASVFGFLARWSREKLAARFWLEWRGRVFEHVVGLPLGQGLGQKGGGQAGELVSRVQFDTYSLRNLYTGVFPSVVDLVVGTGVTVAALVYLAPVMTLVALGAVPVVVLVAWIFRDRIAPLTRQVATHHGRVYAAVTEGLNGLEALKTYDTAGQFAGHLHQAGEDLRDAQLKLARFQATLFPLLNFAIALVLLGVLVAGGQMAIAGGISVGTLVAYYYYVSRSLGPIRGATGIVFGWHRAKAASARLEELFAIDAALPFPDPPARIPDSPAELVFEAVSFAYPGDDLDEYEELDEHDELEEHQEKEESQEQNIGELAKKSLGPPVLRDISFRLASGGRVALLGASGGGKSTLTRLVPRLFDPISGTVSYGGVALTEFEPKSWRALVGYVGQEVFLFHGTIAQNIRFGATRELSDEEVQWAARLARVDEIAASKPEGLHAPVGEKGAMLSGGQRKRVGLARALVRRPRVLVIDQLAADLEADLCRAIFEDLRRELPALAILHVGHRVPAGFKPDETFWIERGELQVFDQT